jgi:hypothetical protein
MPFNGGTIDIDVGLIAVAARNTIGSFIQVLGW